VSALPASPAGLRATSLLAEGADVARDPLLIEVLRQFEPLYLEFRADPDAVRGGLLVSYRALCATLGRAVRVELPGDKTLEGVASDIDADGRLLVHAAGAPGPVAVSAGDVIHVR
jgi:BirA family transcriptional regulator, biotin operon repressor / biotin---[acetyl-CoA-carboxylase] ligase